MNINDNPEVEDLGEFPEDWENNMGLTYTQYYGTLNIEQMNITDLGNTLARILLEVVVSNEGRDSERTVFEVNIVPEISIRDYIFRIIKYSECSPEVFIGAIIYIDKYHIERDTTGLKMENIHK